MEQGEKMKNVSVCVAGTKASVSKMYVDVITEINWLMGEAL